MNFWQKLGAVLKKVAEQRWVKAVVTYKRHILIALGVLALCAIGAWLQLPGWLVVPVAVVAGGYAFYVFVKLRTGAP